MLDKFDDIYSEGYYFQQDNARIHTSKYAMNFFDENFVELLDWPAYSPDLNPIENLWSIIKHELDNCDEFKSFAEFKTKIFKIWENIDQSRIDKLINSMSSRIEQCIEREGWPTDY